MKYDGSSPERIEQPNGEMESLELRWCPWEWGHQHQHWPVIRSAALLSHTDDSNYIKINYDNKNNMQSVKISLVLDFTNNFEHKGIANNCLISDISLILCVPNMIRYNCYSDINLNITKRKKDRVIEMEMTDTKNFGAFPQMWKIQSQSISKTVDINCDFEIFFNKYILINQIVGEAPSDSIPVTKNAIYVQGIKYGHPHSNSFNPNLMYKGDEVTRTSSPTDKSDYAFIHTTRIISNHSVFPEADTVSTQHLEVIEDDVRPLEHTNTPPFSGDTFKNGDYTFAALLDMVEQAPRRLAELRMRGGTPPTLRLAGGGESSLNTPSGWGSPPGPNNNGTASWGNSGSAAGGAGGPASQWGATQRPPTSQPDGNSNKMGGNGIPGSNGAGSNGGGWGGTGAPPPPTQPPPTGGGSGGGSPGGGPGAPQAPAAAPTAKAQLEQLNTMRESLFSLDGWGGQHVNQDTNWDVPTSPEPGVKQEPGGPGPPAWKPTINNGTDLWEANLRNGGQPPPQPVAKTPWGHTPTSNIGGTWGEDDDTPEASNVWNGPPPQQQWGAPPQQPPHWSAPAKKDDWGGWGEPPRPELHRPDMHRAPAPDPRDMRLMGDMRGDPRGISGRLNGNADMWGQQHMQHMPPKGLMPGVGGGQWSAQGPKDMGMAKGGTGWEEPSPPAARRSMANFDDGTSLWGQQRGAGMGPWKDMGMGRGAMPCPPGMPPGGRMPAVAPGPMKPDAMWGHPHRNGSWEDASSHVGNWDKDTSWNEGPMNQGGAWPGPKGKPMGGPGGSWDSEMGDWCGPKPGGGGPPAKMLPKDMVWNSKQFRLLVDMGYKKDDVELALRSRDMNVEEAMDLLSQMRGGGGMDTWRRHEEHPGGPPFDHQQYPAPPRPHHSYPPQAPPGGPFPQPSQGISSINNISPALVQKILSQPTSQPPPPFNQQNNQSGGGSQPSTAQLRMLVQQIQMAVTAGYLNHQILNQPLAPQTLVLLNQLLQQIKVLQQFASQQSAMQSSLVNKGSTSAMLHITVQMTKTKQQISSLQQQISAQQAIYVKQQAGSSSGSGGGDFFNKQHDPLAQLQNNFADIALNKDPPSSYGGGGGQQSRLNQWKLPSLDKEGDGPEFSRAPGTTSKPTSSPQLNPLNLQPDNTWSTGRSVTGVDGWPSDGADLTEGKEAWPSSQQHSAASTYTDLVPEFEPGKPWKGNQMKSIEDDPAITPGSVVRSPLSLAAIKEPESLGGGKASPTTPSERSLSSSTWSYPPPAASTPSSGKELWGSKLRSPPGLAGSKGPASSAPWAAPAPPRTSAYPPQPSWPSTWLLLKNLTAQIDGSTLKTLCMQHGPLQSFHLYLNQGIALAKYGSREEANKAQTALNNCVLGNTTIFAESPAESDVNMILQHLGQGGGGGAQWRGSKDSWAFSSPWEEQRATPSQLSSFLPPDLLGGESM